MIVQSYDCHTLKQFIMSKPFSFVYKQWIKCVSGRFCYNFTLYHGKKTNISEFDKLLLCKNFKKRDKSFKIRSLLELLLNYALLTIRK